MHNRQCLPVIPARLLTPGGLQIHRDESDGLPSIEWFSRLINGRWCGGKIVREQLGIICELESLSANPQRHFGPLTQKANDLYNELVRA